MILNEILFQYQNLIFKVDSACRKLEELHREHLVCRPGCSSCCKAERTVCGVEAYVVEQQLLTLSRQKINRLKKYHRHDDETCPLLLKDRCVIYPARPIICRTHGLPILYREAERAFVDYCRLNFSRLPDNYEFQPDEILDMNPFNIELIEIDKKYSEHVLNQKWRPDNRTTLKSILFNLNLKRQRRSS